MTNEEIVKAIKCEEDPERKNNLYLELWGKIRRFVQLKAIDRAKAAREKDYIPDMLQEAFIILSEAVDYYEADGGASFLHVYASFFMSKAFNMALYGGCTKKDYEDLLNTSLSLDMEIKEGDSEAGTLGDMISDPSAENELYGIEDGHFWDNVGSLLWEGVSLLPEEQKRLLTFVYMNNVTIREAIDFKVIGEGNKRHYYNTFNTGNKKLLEWLNRDRKKQTAEIGIYDFLGLVKPRGYYGAGLGSFKSDHTSVVERMAIKHIDGIQKSKM